MADGPDGGSKTETLNAPLYCVPWMGEGFTMFRITSETTSPTDLVSMCESRSIRWVAVLRRVTPLDGEGPNARIDQIVHMARSGSGVEVRYSVDVHTDGDVQNASRSKTIPPAEAATMIADYLKQDGWRLLDRAWTPDFVQAQFDSASFESIDVCDWMDQISDENLTRVPDMEIVDDGIPSVADTLGFDKVSLWWSGENHNAAGTLYCAALRDRTRIDTMLLASVPMNRYNRH